jgi:hypothetical protein
MDSCSFMVTLFYLVIPGYFQFPEDINCRFHPELFANFAKFSTFVFLKNKERDGYEQQQSKDGEEQQQATYIGIK